MLVQSEETFFSVLNHQDDDCYKCQNDNTSDFEQYNEKTNQAMEMNLRDESLEECVRC